MLTDLFDSLPITGVFVAFAVSRALVVRSRLPLRALVAEPHAGGEGRADGHDRGLDPGLDGVPARDHHGHGHRSLRCAARRGAGRGQRRRHHLPAGRLSSRTGRQPEPGAAAGVRAAPDGAGRHGGHRRVLARSDEILGELWTMAEELARSTPDSEMLALYIESLNETIDVNTTRVTAGLYARVPETIVDLLVSRCCSDAGDGRLQRRPDGQAQPAHGPRAGRRPGSGHRPHRGPRPPLRRHAHDEPAAAHHAPAADRPAIALAGSARSRRAHATRE